VLSGGTYLPAQALRDFRGGYTQSPTNATALTPRQLDVLRRLIRGEPNKVIAGNLGLSEGTVRIHVEAILRSLQVRNRTEAVIVARNIGIET
jgi:DNA-binding NarL/FixJ family response regulator